MSWEDLNIKEKSDLMRLYISNGIMDLDSIREHYNSFATGGALPDHDPNNPYHYHDAEGNKVVISPEDWEANVGKPYFREIEDAVRAEQAAYPEPEYEVNPAFMRDLNSSVAAVRGQNGMINYVGYKNQLPQGYTINENGIIFDDKGQAYVQESYPQSTRFTYNTDSPLQFTFNQGKPIERNVNFYPVNMDMRVKAPLPVDRVMDVGEEYNSAINNYIKDNTTPKKKIHYINSAFVSYLHPEIAATDDRNDYNRAVKNAKKLGYKVLENYRPNQFNSFLIGFDDNEFDKWQKEMYDRFGDEDGEVYFDNTTLKRTINGDHVYFNGKDLGTMWSDGPNGPMGYQVRYEGGAPSRKEAEKKAVIKIGLLKKTKTFEKGGPINNKSDWAKAHEIELALQQLGWNNSDNKLHSDYAAKDDEGYYAGYNLKPVTVVAEHPIRKWDKTVSLQDPHFDDLYQHYLNREEAGKEYLKNIGRVGLAVGTLPMLSYGAVAAPLATGLSLAGGEGLNYGINKLTPYTSWGNMLADGVFNTGNELAQTALEFTNPGFLLGPKAAPFINNQYRGLRVANELRRGIRNVELQPRVVKNTAHTRTKLGDVEIDDPNIMYHVDNGDYTGFSGSGAYVKDGMLFPSQHYNGQKPYTWWNLGSPYRNGQTRLLTITKDNPSLLRVRDQNYPIGQWTGNPKDRTFVTNQEYVSSEPIRIGNEYKLVPNYGYKRVQKFIPTLEQDYQGRMNAEVQGSSIYKSSPEETHDFLAKILLGQVADPSTSFKIPNYLYRSGVDYIERGISPEVRNLVETQVKPRLLTEDTRFKLAEWNPSYAREFNDAINKTVKSTEVSEWSKEMMEDYNRVNNVNFGGFSLNNKPRIIIGKNSNMPVSTVETHELRHQLQKTVSRTPTEYDVLKEAYGDVPQPRKRDGSIDASYNMSQEWETMNTEARKILLEKAGYKYDATKSLEENVIEQDKILENYKNSDLVRILYDNADGYWKNFIDEFRSKCSEEKRAKVAAWKKAMQLVGASTGIIGTGALSQNK